MDLSSLPREKWWGMIILSNLEDFGLDLNEPENVLFVTFENMLEDPHGHVKKLSDFLGCPFEKEEDDEVEEIVKNCSIERIDTLTKEIFHSLGFVYGI
ncbi:hydroxyjasmonate sulfotransferase [Salvia divinorum]|uniref:Sulfotransferase n=1 Tax=Salvia divinorum TaxID=28513 RepID=A0ABD1FSA0_SALDI